jgi:hypothetical protein
MSQTILEYAPPKEFDTGLFVARYLQGAAFLSVLSMIADPIFFHTFTLDFSPIFWLWFASALKRHSPTARKLFLVFGAFGLCLCGYLIVHAMVFGTSHLTVHFGKPIHNPALWQVIVMAATVAIIIGVPFVILLSARARRQFRQSGR